MNCRFNKDDIISYIDGGLSQERIREIESHMEACEECRRFHDVQVLSGKFAGREFVLDESFANKVVEAVDPHRYKNGRSLISKLEGLIWGIRYLLKPVGILLTVCILSVIMLLNGPQIMDLVNGSLKTPPTGGDNGVKPGISGGESTTSPFVRRPLQKTDNIRIEGMDEEHTFTLLFNNKLELSTYIPDDMTGESAEGDDGAYLMAFANFGGVENRDACVRITAAPKGEQITEEDFIDEAKAELSGKGFKIGETSEENRSGYPFSKPVFDIKKENSDGSKIVGTVLFFTHKGRIYKAVIQYPEEYADGFPPRVNKIFSEIVMNDDTRLFDPVFFGEGKKTVPDNLISDNGVDINQDGKIDRVVIKMTSGRYYEEKDPGPYEGWNWQGGFVVEVMGNDGKTISQYELDTAITGGPLTFNKRFDIAFEDYNGDGMQDFTIGQYASSNGYIYRLMTIDRDGNVSAMPMKGDPELFCDNMGYSARFEKTGGNSFKYRYYDNSKGYFEKHMKWQDGCFELDKTVEAG